MGTSSYTDNLQRMRENLEQEFACFLTRDDFQAKIRLLEKHWNTSARRSILECLYRMMDASGIGYEEDRDIAYYRQLVADADIPSLAVIERRMAKALAEAYAQYPSPSDYLARTIDRIAPREAAGDSLRLRILRRFVRCADALRGAKYNGHREIRKYVANKTGRTVTGSNMADYLEEDIFQLLDSATKSQKKPSGKFGVIKLADDVARGRFKGQGSTKRDLYLFAMAYGMRFYPDPSKADPLLDIEKNLFRDYYSNNLIRFLQEEYRERAGDLEADPTERGINYKNFAEMVYLYYLAGDLPPKEKIQRATRMIDELREQADGAAGAALLDRHTGEYAAAAARSSVFDMPEGEFRQYIADNYECSTFAERTVYQTASGETKELSRNVSSMEIASEQKRAAEKLRGLLDTLEERLARSGATLDDCCDGLWFAQEGSLAGLDDVDPQDVQNLRILLERADRAILNGPELRRRADDAAVSRATLLGAVYYLYITEHEGDDEDQHARLQSFADLYEDFRTEANRWLIDAGYTPFDSRNFLDLLLAFSAYAQLNF